MCRANAFYIWSPVGELLMLWCGGHSWAPRFWCVWCASGSNKRRMVKVPAAVLASRKLWTERWRGTARGWAVWRWHSSFWCLYWVDLITFLCLVGGIGHQSHYTTWDLATTPEQRSGTAMRPRHSEVQGWWKARERARLVLDEVPGIWPNTRMQVDGFFFSSKGDLKILLFEDNFWSSIMGLERRAFNRFHLFTRHADGDSANLFYGTIWSHKFSQGPTAKSQRTNCI